MDKKIESIPRRAMESYQQHDWPGNVREVMNAVERSVILTRGNVLNAYVPASTKPTDSEALSMEEMERKHISETLGKTNWRVRGRDGAAELLRMKPTTLESRMRKLGIRRPSPPIKYRSQ
jgi:transcriptional regulator with GAF, ATPase, and Fis domain